MKAVMLHIKQHFTLNTYYQTKNVMSVWSS